MAKIDLVGLYYTKIVKSLKYLRYSFEKVKTTSGRTVEPEMISRRAFGFRNFNNYRLRVLALCGWNGIINRTRKLH